MEILMLSSAAAAGMVVLALKFGVRRILGYEVLMDLLITGLLMMSLAGTATGMTIALTAGLITSLTLSGLRKIIGYEKLQFMKDRTGNRKLNWVYHKGIVT